MAMARTPRQGRSVCVAVAVILAALGYRAPVAASCNGDTTVNGCSPGSGSTTVNCAAEWVLTPEPALNAKGLPGNRLACFEGDPACDFDAEPDVCSFQLAMCINNDDLRIPSCLPNWIESFELKSPRASSSDPVDVSNRSALEGLTSCSPG